MVIVVAIEERVELLCEGGTALVELDQSLDLVRHIPVKQPR